MENIKIGLTEKWCEDIEGITPDSEQLSTAAINIRFSSNRRIT